VDGNLRDTPLSSVLELIYLNKKSGRVQINADVPLSLSVVQGEIVGGGVLDWQGLEAIQSFALHASSGTFRFTPSDTQVMPQFRMPFSTLMTDWARVNDEWERIRPILHSPSRVLEYVGLPREPAHAFQGGKSIRAVSRTTGVSAFEVASSAVPLLQSGELRLVPKYAWMGLRMQHPAANAGNYTPVARDTSEIPMMLNGRRNLAELLEWGFATDSIRRYLKEAILGGEVQVPGSGWLLRDLTWELEKPLA
jgi:Domain of unknown function (DUF4388)